MAKLAREIISEAGCSHLGDGQPAAGDHQPRRLVDAARRTDLKPGTGSRDLADRCAKTQLAARLMQLAHQHVDNGARPPIAEELAKRLFVPGDVVAGQTVQKILRAKACGADLAKCGLAEMKFAGAVWILVKLHRPPPDMRTFSAGLAAWSMTSTRRPASPARAP